MTTAEETTQSTPTTTLKRCFSGSGKYANRKWAPGGDATYLSRLRKAHLADETLPDPWYIQEHGGIEADNVPEDGWPQLSAMDIAQRLDQERGAGVESHWAATLDAAKEKAAQKDQAKSERQRAAAATKAERDAERARQAKRPKKGSTVRFTSGDNEGREAEVLRAISPTQLLIKFTDGDTREELAADEEIELISQPEPAEGEPTEGEPAQAEGEFVEQ